MKQRSPEYVLNHYIDTLNEEKRPEASAEPDIAELEATVHLLRSFRPSQEPRTEFTKQLYRQLQTKSNTRRRFLPWAALVAGFLALALLISPWNYGNKDIVLAMEQTVKQLQNYHGNLEKISTNAAGERQVISRTEIWAAGNQYATRSEDGSLSVNNGVQRWKIEPKNQEVTLLPVYLDPHDFDLQKEAERAIQHPHKILGQDTVAGRPATRLEIDPPGGLPYFLWIDTETHLPIQLQTAMQKSIQTTYTFVTLETNIKIPDSIFSFSTPEGYKLVNNNIDQAVGSLSEAITMSALTPLQPAEQPERFFAARGRIVFDFGDTVIIETKAPSSFAPSPLASIGQVSGSPLEVLPDTLRWQQNGLEIKIQGARAEKFAKELAPTLVLPQAGQQPNNQPMVKVEVDLEIVKRNQQQVDAGSSPWQLDPVQVAFTFAATHISPQGIMGKPPLDFDALKVTSNTGTEAVVAITEGPIKTVYVKRLIRQDQSGIWTVVGYDPRQ